MVVYSGSQNGVNCVTQLHRVRGRPLIIWGWSELKKKLSGASLKKERLERGPGTGPWIRESPKKNSVRENPDHAPPR